MLQAERALAESAELQELDREPANALTCDPLLMTRSGREGLQQKGGGGDGAGIRVRSSPVESPRREDDGQQAIPSVRVEDEEEEESVNLSEVDDDEISKFRGVRAEGRSDACERFMPEDARGSSAPGDRVG
eukprot:763647-Hanusia_phi.AAC.3